MCCEWHALTLVVVNDLYVVGVALPEYKANTPTCVQGHRPLAFAVSLELVQSDAFKWAPSLAGCWRRSMPTTNPTLRQKCGRHAGRACSVTRSNDAATITRFRQARIAWLHSRY